MKAKIVQDYTSGNVTKQLLKFTFPLFLGTLLQTLYNTVDMVVVGNVMGSAGISGVSIGGDFSNLFTILIIGFSTAAQIIISQFLGAGRMDKLKTFIGTFVTSLFLAGILLSLIGICFSKQLLNWMNTPEEAYSEALAYSVVMMCGLIFVCGYNAVTSILKGLGDSKHPFIFIAISSVANIGLDILFVIGFKTGAMGAAIATIMSQALSFVCALVFLMKQKEFSEFAFKPHDFKINKEMLGQLLKLGLPMALKSAAVTFSKVFTNSFINSYGVTVSAVTGVGYKISHVAALVSNSFSGSSSSMIGQNIGAEKYDRVLKIIYTVFIINVGVSLIMTPFIIFYPQQLFKIFTSDYSILPVAVQYVPSLIVVMFSNATRSFSNALINGSGNHKINFALAILDAFVLRIGLSLLLGLVFNMGYRGFWMGSALSGFTPFAVGMVYLISGKWKTRKYIIHD